MAEEEGPRERARRVDVTCRRFDARQQRRDVVHVKVRPKNKVLRQIPRLDAEREDERREREASSEDVRSEDVRRAGCFEALESPLSERRRPVTEGSEVSFDEFAPEEFAPDGTCRARGSR